MILSWRTVKVKGSGLVTHSELLHAVLNGMGGLDSKAEEGR